MNFTTDQLERIKVVTSVKQIRTRKLVADLLEAHAIIDRLDKTKDGEPITPDMPIFIVVNGEVFGGKTFRRSCFDPARGTAIEVIVGKTETAFGTNELYSTEAVAQAALANSPITQ